MIEAFQKILQDVCVSALAVMAVFAALCFVAKMGRRVMAKLPSVALVVFLFVVSASSVIIGGGKTNGLLQAILPFVPQVQQVQLLQVQPVVPPPVPRISAPSPRTSADMPFRARAWNRRGAWDDSFRCAFPGEWVFPHGTGHLDRVEVCSQGRILPRYGSTNVIADVGVPLQIVNPLTSFGCGPTASNSYVFAWTNAVVGRASREDIANAETIDAYIELFRNGDVAITTNGVTELRPRVLPFPRSGYGQDDEWVAANFTNATEILAVGYPQWVDAQVGEGLTNGLYKLTVTVPDDPPETTLLTVGDLSVAVTNAGDYVFLLEKGVDYEYGTVPFIANAVYSAIDDVPQTRGGTPSPDPEGQTHSWSVDGGRYAVAPQTESALGRVLWLPLFFGSPDVAHIGPGDGPFTFVANFLDCRTEPAATYSWSASPGVTVQSPNAKTTAISFDTMPSWAVASVSVTAAFGTNTLVSVLGGMTYGTNDVPQIHLSLDVPDAILLNSNVVSTAKVAVASWSFSSDVPTSGVVTVSCISGADKVECQGLLGSWDVDDAFSVTSHVAGVSTSAAIGDVVLMAEFSSYGGTNAVSRGMTVVRAGNVTIPAAPTNGLVVLVNTPVTMMMDCEPEGAGAFLTTMWHARRLKSDGTYEEWQLAAYGQRGVATVFTPTQGGIYQVRSTASVESGGYDERFYVWDADEVRTIGSGRSGNPKSFGVVSHLWQKTLRDCALGFLGSTAYLSTEFLSAQYGFPAYPAGDLIFKCNIFVAHRIVQSGLTCPKTRGWFNSYPPLANDWANPAYAIGNWVPLLSGEYPEPGYVSADPDPDTSGHMGIIDFDGSGISAGTANVNRHFDSCAPGIVIRKLEE